MSHMVFGSTPLVAGTPQIAVSLQKHIMDHVRISAREKAAVEMIQSSGGQAISEEQMLDVEARTAQYVAEGMTALKQLSAQLSAPGPDPLVQLKEKELQVRAQAEQNDAQIDAAKLGLEQQKVQQRDEQFDKRLDSQERQTAARINAAERREMMKQQKGGQ